MKNFASFEKLIQGMISILGSNYNFSVKTKLRPREFDLVDTRVCNSDQTPTLKNSVRFGWDASDELKWFELIRTTSTKQIFEFDRGHIW